MDHTITLATNPGGWSVFFGPWNHPEKFNLDGFPTAWDAWAFVVANGLGNPSAGLPSAVRRWELKPPPEPGQELQPGLFGQEVA